MLTSEKNSMVMTAMESSDTMPPPTVRTPLSELILERVNPSRLVKALSMATSSGPVYIYGAIYVYGRV
jgi:hypothetical protein